MSKITARIEDKILIIEKETSRENPNNIERISLDLLEYEKRYKSSITVSNNTQKDSIIFLQKVEGLKYDVDGEDEEVDTEKKEVDNVVIVYSDNNVIRYCYCNIETAYKRLVSLKFKVLKVSLNKRRLKIRILAYLINKYKLNITETKFYIDQELERECTLKQYGALLTKAQMLKQGIVSTYTFKIEDILKDESTINGSIRYGMKINGIEVEYKVGVKDKRQKNTQHYYAPMRSTYTKDFAVHIRRTIKGNLVLVQRPKEDIERTLKFKIMESKLVSGALYGISKILVPRRKKKINIFYEKFASKAEEGAYDLFLLSQKNGRSKDYFIITKDSVDYERIKDNKNVVPKYSMKYYWLIYNANNFISTEAAIHLNILRSNNTALRKSLSDKPFIFLQHGVTYLKCQGKNSTFSKNKEGEATYIVVGSEKEKDVVVESLQIDEERVLKTGLPIFSKVEYNHINKESDDYITVMLTWKPYEEQLYDFEKSNYYKDTIAICEMLKKYVDREKIILISHPKAQNLLMQTDLKNSLWSEPISKALEKTKLLITDYSSVCYNAFYQGAGVIFYQPDLELYEKENGELIPNKNEYIGKRVFNINELENVIKETINNKKINLDKVRTKEQEKIYSTINEFSDGKNIQRIYDKLVELKLL